MNIDQLREQLAGGNNARRLVGVACVIIALVALACLLRHFRHPAVPRPTGRYFANEFTGALSLEPMDAHPPLPDASGKPAMVYAMLYSTDGGKTKVAAYYEEYTPDAKRNLDNEPAGQPLSPEEMDVVTHGMLVRLPASGSPWVPAESPAGIAVIASLPTGPKITQCSLQLP